MKINLQSAVQQTLQARLDSEGRLLCRCPDCGKDWTATPLQTEAMLKAMGIMESGGMSPINQPPEKSRESPRRL